MRQLVALVALILGGCANEPPYAPLVFGPQMGRPNAVLRFSCLAADREGDSVSYQFRWGDGSQGEWSSWMAAGTEYSETHRYADTGVFQVSCRARDRRKETDWADSIQVSIRDYGPLVPRRPVGPDTAVVGDTVRFLTRAGHPLQERVAVQFCFGEALTEWSRFVSPDSIVKILYVFLQPGVFEVRARAKDSLEHISEWSSPKAVWVEGRAR